MLAISESERKHDLIKKQARSSILNTTESITIINERDKRVELNLGPWVQKEDQRGGGWHLGGDEMAATPLGRDDDGFLSPLTGHGIGGGVPYCGRDDRIPLVGSQSEERRRAGTAAEDNGRGRLHQFSE